MSRYQVEKEDYPRLADALGESPGTTVAVHQLRRGLCKAFLAGRPDQFEAVVMQYDFMPTELTGFGEDAEAMWRLLQTVRGWDCVCVSNSCASTLGPLVEHETGRPVRYPRAVDLQLNRPAIRFRHPDVRLLSVEDAPMWDRSDEALRAAGFEDTETLLREGFAAGAVIDSELVSVIQMSALTRRFGDVGGHTLEPCRRRGYAATGLSMVAEKVQQRGLTPIWSTGETNLASLGVAKKVGFEEVEWSTYVVPERRRQRSRDTHIDHPSEASSE